MDGYTCKYSDIQDWEIVCIGETYYGFLSGTGRSVADAPLTPYDWDRLLDAYHCWKVLLGYTEPEFQNRAGLMHLLHFDVAIELFLHRKLREKMDLKRIF